MNGPAKMETVRNEWGAQVEALPGDYAGQTRLTYIREDLVRPLLEALGEARCLTAAMCDSPYWGERDKELARPLDRKLRDALADYAEATNA